MSLSVVMSFHGLQEPQTSDFTVKALLTLNSLNRRNFQTKIDMEIKIRFYAKLCTQNKIFASKMQHLQQQKTSVFAPLILKRWIILLGYEKQFLRGTKLFFLNKILDEVTDQRLKEKSTDIWKWWITWPVWKSPGKTCYLSVYLCFVHKDFWMGY